MNNCLPTAPTDSQFATLNALGLNLQAVFNMGDLPVEVLAAVPAHERQPYRQLLLIGHLGPVLWQQLVVHGMEAEHPVDSFSHAHVSAWMASEQPGRAYRFIYPGPTTIGLQRLGVLAGWHHASPFMVGVNSLWGSWFAYRAVVFADTHLTPTALLNSTSPCSSCATRVCVSQCPAKALDPCFDLPACLAYRQRPESTCRDRCMARNSCPVGESYRYSDDQISYHYGQSMKAIALHTA